MAGEGGKVGGMDMAQWTDVLVAEQTSPAIVRIQ